MGPWWVSSRYQATAMSMSVSVTRSATESKNAPRTLARPDALATAPSSRSGTAEAINRPRPKPNRPVAMAHAAGTARIKPRAVR